MIATSQAFLFEDLGPRRVQADFSGGTLSTDAGALLLRQVDANLGLAAELAQCFYDTRNRSWVDHSVAELLRQRLFGTALGYEDINDHQRLRLEPLLAAACGKTDPAGEQRVLPQFRGVALAAPSRSTAWSCRITRIRAATNCRTTRRGWKPACSKWGCALCPNTPKR